MAKRIFRKRTKKGTAVTTTYVPKRKMSKRIKNYSYGTSRGRSHVVEVTTKKVFKSAKTASKYRARAKK